MLSRPSVLYKNELLNVFAICYSRSGLLTVPLQHVASPNHLSASMEAIHSGVRSATRAHARQANRFVSYTCTVRSVQFVAQALLWQAVPCIAAGLQSEFTMS